MLRISFCRTFLVTLIYSAILVLVISDPPRNWKAITLKEVDMAEIGSEVNPDTYFEVNTVEDQIKATGMIKLDGDISPKTTVKWKAMYMNPDDNQLRTQAESKPTGLCDFLVFQRAVAQMFFENSNMTVCPFEKGTYVFKGSGPNKNAFPQKIPKGRDSWTVEVVAEEMGRIVARMNIKADLTR